MKILVPVKRVPDPNSTIKVKPDGSGIVTDGLKWVINPFDEIAIEEALRIKEKLGGGEVVLVGIGSKASSEQLRTGLAMGADRAALCKKLGRFPAVTSRPVTRNPKETRAVKILVTVKRVPDPETVIKIAADGAGIATDNVKWVINPFDEIAIEEALRVKEKVNGTEVVLVSIGAKAAQEQLRTGLAMGADRAILVLSDQALEPLAVARILHKLIDGEKPDLVLMGKQAIDDDSNATGQMLAELLGWPQATFASKVELAGDAKSATVTREVDGGLETIAVPLPAVVTADLRLNEPRYASLPGIMKARKKELKEIPVADLGIDVAPLTRIVKLETPPKRSGGRKVGSVQELVQMLHTEAKVI